MFFCLLILAAICLYQIKFARNHEDYMEFGQTNSIKGIFTAIILLSHMRQYISATLPMDNVAVFVLNNIGQLMVAMFFFYSGYGILCSVSRKTQYSKTFFKNRIIKTWLHFIIAVACYLLLSIAIGTKYTIWEYLLCWTGWTSLGNSNWFVFIILVQYLATWVCLLVSERYLKKCQIPALTTMVFGFSLCLWALLHKAGQSSYWYNTLLCYPFGICFFALKPYFDKLCKKRFLLSAVWVIFLAIAWGLRSMKSLVAYSLYACAFCALIVLFTKTVKLDNPILRWLGKHSFTIYIFQRIPMIILHKVGFAEYNVLFILASVSITLLLSVVFNWLYQKIDKLSEKKLRK